MRSTLQRKRTTVTALPTEIWLIFELVYHNLGSLQQALPTTQITHFYVTALQASITATQGLGVDVDGCCRVTSGEAPERQDFGWPALVRGL
jgi:hypothetical protein